MTLNSGVTGMGKIIVLGAEGFVGSYLCRALNEKDMAYLPVDIAPSSNKCTVQADLTRRKSLDSIPIHSDDTVVHLAARQFANKPPRKNRPEFFIEVNVRGTENVIGWMKQHSCRNLIYFSTDMVYGLPQYLPIDTRHVRQPIGDYGASKKMSEDHCFRFRSDGGVVTVFRPRAIVGPGRFGIFTKLFYLIERNLPVPLIGKGDNVYQMINVFDCVSAIMCLLNAGMRNAEYNLGSLNPPPVYDLLTSLIKEAGSRSRLIKIHGGLVKGIIKTLATLGLEIMYKEQYEIADQMYIVDIESTIQELGWRPVYSDDVSLAAAYKEYTATRV